MHLLTEIFGDYPRVRILEAFAENGNEMLYIADLVRITKLSKMTVNTHINKLMEEGMIQKTKKVGIVQYYQLNEGEKKVKVVLDIVKNINSTNMLVPDDVFFSPFDDTQTPYTYSTTETTTANSSRLNIDLEEKNNDKTDN